MNQDNIYNQIKDLLAKAGGKYSILEEQINVELQVEFFEMLNKLLKKKRTVFEVIADESKLYDSKITNDVKKLILAELSTSENVESYRIIERFIDSKHEKLNQWAVLALQHGRISLETYLLNEQQVFISTGLGGLHDKLRYFMVGRLKKGASFNNIQKKVIKTEFEIGFRTYSSVLEELLFSEDYFTVLGLIPLNVSVAELVEKSIAESNLYGDFISSEYLVTNVRILEQNEIDTYFKNKGI